LRLPKNDEENAGIYPGILKGPFIDNIKGIWIQHNSFYR
jgi:hypothetical protein